MSHHGTHEGRHESGARAHSWSIQRPRASRRRRGRSHPPVPRGSVNFVGSGGIWWDSTWTGRARRAEQSSRRLHRAEAFQVVQRLHLHPTPSTSRSASAGSRRPPPIGFPARAGGGLSLGLQICACARASWKPPPPRVGSIRFPSVPRESFQAIGIPGRAGAGIRTYIEARSPSGWWDSVGGRCSEVIRAG